MRCWVFSDLHLDIGAYVLPKRRPAHDIVVIAGDICEGLHRGVEWIAAAGLNRVPVIYVAGNHEFFRDTRDGGLIEGRKAAARHKNIHLLQDDGLTLDGIRILGATLWTDYKLHGLAEQMNAMQAAQMYVNDHHAIRLGRAGFRRWLPQDALAEHQVSRDWLAREIEAADGSPTLVVTHHGPSIKSLAERFIGNVLNPAFHSHLDELVADADLWVHGHSHVMCDYQLGRARVVNNPRGYVSQQGSEDTGFDPTLVVELRTQTPATSKGRAP